MNNITTASAKPATTYITEVPDRPDYSDRKKARARVPDYQTLMEAIRDSRVCEGSQAKRKVLESLLLLCDSTIWVACPTYAVIADDAGVNIRTAQQGMAELVAEGIVARFHRTWISNEYVVNWRLLLDKAGYQYGTRKSGSLYIHKLPTKRLKRLFRLPYSGWIPPFD